MVAWSAHGQGINEYALGPPIRLLFQANGAPGVGEEGPQGATPMAGGTAAHFSPSLRRMENP